MATRLRGLAPGDLEPLLAALEADRVLRPGELEVETSGSAPYAPAQAFYAARGFHVAAHIPDFYRPDDPKVVYTKALHP
ncbi:MAG: hypothetical protein P1P84_23855 [Deferrisomatales bacterium]|nr:hypothetical protein [Deferrisomatales bacterium]